MKRLRLVPDNTNIGFISKRYIALALSACLLLGSFGLLGGKGLNLGIDFLGGILMEVKTKGPADIGALRSKIGSLGLGEVSIQEFGAPDDVLIRVQRQEGGDKQQQRAVKFISDAIVDDVVELERLAGALRGKGITISAEDVAEEAVSQGLLIRRSDGAYLLLG